MKKTHEDELLAYIRKDKQTSKRFTLYPSLKYPNDTIEIITKKNKNSESELFIQRIQPNKPTEIISKKYEYYGKESQIFQDITLPDLIKKSKLNYVLNYLDIDALKYDNKSLNKKLRSLNVDMKETILNKLLLVKESPNSHSRLSEVNKNFGNARSYAARINQLAGPDTESMEKLRYINNSIVDILGNITLKKLEGNDLIAKRIRDALGNIPEASRKLYDDLKEHERSLEINRYLTYDALKKSYSSKNPKLNDFEKKIKLWEDQWDIDHNLFLHFGDIQSAMDLYKNDMIEFEDDENQKKTRRKINEFLKLDDGITFKKYVDAIKKLPLSVKVVMHAKW